MTNLANLQAILPAAQMAAARTTHVRKSDVTGHESFLAALDVAKPRKPDGGSTPMAPVTPVVAHQSRVASPLEQFEGFVLRSFVESMLPSEASSYFGEGTAGDVWRSMMAEEIGNELARNGGIGIADSIRGRTPAETEPGSAGLSAAGSLNSMLRQADLARADAARTHLAE